VTIVTNVNCQTGLKSCKNQGLEKFSRNVFDIKRVSEIKNSYFDKCRVTVSS